MTSPDDLPALEWQGRVLDARLQLLDRQLHDVNGLPIGTVDDISLDGLTVGTDIPPGSPAPTVAAVVSGRVLATRIFGGHPPESRLTFINWALVDRLATVLTLRVSGADFDSMWFENWLRDQIVARIPGGRHVPE